MGRAYYNEIDPYAAQWLRNLIAAGHIADGDVDERSIVDVAPSEIAGYTQCHFFAGIGVWSHALRGAGWSDDREVWTGSCPCQPFSAAGKKRGTQDSRHLWPDFFRLIRICKPDIVFGEQVASKDALDWLDLVSTDLENEGYTVGAVDTCAAGFGSPNIRQRLYWVADTKLHGHHEVSIRRSVDAGDGARGMLQSERQSTLLCRDGRRRPCESQLVPVVAVSTDVLGRLRAYGNAMNAAQAQGFVESYLDVTA